MVYRIFFFSSTDSDGRGRFLASSRWQAGVYRLHFDTDAYFKAKQVTGFYPYVEVRIFRYAHSFAINWQSTFLNQRKPEE